MLYRAADFGPGLCRQGERLLVLAGSALCQRMFDSGLVGAVIPKGLPQVVMLMGIQPASWLAGSAGKMKFETLNHGFRYAFPLNSHPSSLHNQPDLMKEGQNPAIANLPLHPDPFRQSLSEKCTPSYTNFLVLAFSSCGWWAPKRYPLVVLWMAHDQKFLNDF